MKKILFLFFISFLGALVWLFWPEEVEEVSSVDLPAVEKREEPAYLVADESIAESTNAPDPATELIADVDSTGPISSFPVESLELFFPQELNQELKRLIAKDLAIIYGDVTSAEILKVNPPIVTTSGNEEYDLLEYIDFRGPGRYFPDEIEGIYIYETTMGKQVFVSDQIVEAYRIAKNRKEENIQVYNQLEDFLYTMNNLNLVNLDAPEERFYLYGEAKKYETEMLGALNLQAFRDAYGQYKYRTPSLLEIKKGYQFNADFRGLEDKFIAKVYTYDQSGKINDGSPPFVYHEGKWKLLIVIPGT